MKPLVSLLLLTAVAIYSCECSIAVNFVLGKAPDIDKYSYGICGQCTGKGTTRSTQFWKCHPSVDHINRTYRLYLPPCNYVWRWQRRGQPKDVTELSGYGARRLSLAHMSKCSQPSLGITVRRDWNIQSSQHDYTCNEDIPSHTTTRRLTTTRHSSTSAVVTTTQPSTRSRTESESTHTDAARTSNQGVPELVTVRMSLKGTPGPPSFKYAVCGRCTIENITPETTQWTCSTPRDPSTHNYTLHLPMCRYEYKWTEFSNLTTKTDKESFLGVLELHRACRSTGYRKAVVIMSRWNAGTGRFFYCNKKTTPRMMTTASTTTPAPSNCVPYIYVQLDSFELSTKVSVNPDLNMTLPAGNFSVQTIVDGVNCNTDITVAKAERNETCPEKLTFITSAATSQAALSLPVDGVLHDLYLPVGVYPYTITSDSSVCSTSLHVYDGAVMRRLVIQADYDVKCDTYKASSDITRTVAEHRYQDINILTDGLTSSLNSKLIADLSCSDNVLRVSWPTDAVFPADIHEVPDHVSTLIKKRLTSKNIKMELFIAGQLPPVVLPLRQSDGFSVKLVITSSCYDGKHYDKLSDTCKAQ